MRAFHRMRLRFTTDPRLARILHGSLSSFAGRGLAILVSAITLPLTVHYLGQLEYGIWVTISGTVVMLSVLDLGIANTLTNFLSEAYANDDRDKARTHFSTAFWLTCSISATLALIFAALWHLVDWGSLLHITDPVLIRHARRTVAVAIAYFLLSMPSNLANRVLSGYQQVHLANYFAMANSVLGLVAILTVISFHGNLVQLMIAYCGAMLIGSAALNCWLLLLHKPWLRPRPSQVRGWAAKALFRQGFLFFLIQLTTLVVFNSDNLVITHYLGPAEVTPYSIAWRLTSYASMLQAILVPSFWPAFTESYHKRELPWLRNTYKMLMRKTMFIVAASAILIGLLGRPVIRFWTGSGAVPPSHLLWTMALWAVLVTFTSNQALLLTATGRLQVAATVAIIAAITNLALSIYLVQRIGAEGVILATIFSFAIFMVLPQAWEVKRVLGGRFLPRTSAVGESMRKESV
jgi:O-antigen/teichoic acid export membrane protein